MSASSLIDSYPKSCVSDREATRPPWLRSLSLGLKKGCLERGRHTEPWGPGWAGAVCGGAEGDGLGAHCWWKVAVGSGEPLKVWGKGCLQAKACTALPGEGGPSSSGAT